MDIEKELVNLLKLGREERFLDYKESVAWADYKLKIAKTALGMANLRDGGTIIIGVCEENGKFIARGIKEEHLTTYNQDDVQAFVNSYADPYVRIELHQVEDSKLKFLAIVIHEFEEVPVICRKDGGNGTLRKGAIYTRSYRMPETCEVPSQTEMREIIEIATERGIKRYLIVSARLGVPIDQMAKMSNQDAFAKQRGDL